MKPKTPRERVAAHLQAAGYDAEPEEIVHIHGGKHKVLNDTLECWHVFVKHEGVTIRIEGGDTLTRCAKGIEIKPNTPQTCLYGDLIAYPISKPRTSQSFEDERHVDRMEFNR